MHLARQWWLTLQRDLQEAGWRTCKLEPCDMTLHLKGKLIGILCYHVDDIMIAGDENSKPYKDALLHVQSMYEWESWEEGSFEMCGVKIEQQVDFSVCLDQCAYSRAIQPIVLSAHRRRHESEKLTEAEHWMVIAKRGELSWLAQQSMICLMAPLPLVDASGEATGRTLSELNTLVRLAHTAAEDKLWYRPLSEVSFVTYADAAWANRRDLTSQCGYICVATEKEILNGSAAPCNPIAWHSKQCPRVARSSGSAETQGAAQGQEEMEYVRLLWYEISHGGVELPQADSLVASGAGGVLVIDAKGVIDAISRSESAALSMADKRSAVEGLALKESLGRTRTLLRWIHSEANVADALTKFDHRACGLLREFLRSPVWVLKYDPTFTSSKKLRAAALTKRRRQEIAKKKCVDMN